MHEYSIVQALLDRVAQEARRRGATRVHVVRVRIGEVAGVETDLLRTAYETIRRGTPCENAPLEITSTAARWQCPACGMPVTQGGPLRCRECGVPARLVSGDEIMLDRIDMEVA